MVLDVAAEDGVLAAMDVAMAVAAAGAVEVAVTTLPLGATLDDNGTMEDGTADDRTSDDVAANDGAADTADDRTSDGVAVVFGLGMRVVVVRTPGSVDGNARTIGGRGYV